MPAAVELACAQCGRKHSEDALTCALCGHVLRRAASVRAAPTRPQRDEDAPAFAADAPAAREPWLYLGVGLVAAPVFAWAPILGFMGWFLAALVHEMGHAAAAWLCGMPSIPAISLAGHAAAVHQEQSVVLALAVTGGLVLGAWHVLGGRARWVGAGVVGLGHLALAFTGARELLHLLAGHGAELLFAILCLWKTLDGGFTRSRVERGLYALVGWYLLGTNAWLCWGLVASGLARAEYRSSGSFGLTNDYVRVAEDVLGWRLPSVAGLMLVACALVLPAAFALWRLGRRLASR
jgi:hypothetical protein